MRAGLRPVAGEILQMFRRRQAWFRAVRQIEGRIDWSAIVRIGTGCVLEIGVGSRVGYGTILAAKPEGSQCGTIRIGRRTAVNEYNNLRAEGAEIRIGDDCLISQFVSLIASGHEYRRRDLLIVEQGVAPRRGVVIEDDVWIGTGAVVTPGVRIGRGAVVGSGAVVTKDIDPYMIVAGIPARRIGARQ